MTYEELVSHYAEAGIVISPAMDNEAIIGEVWR